MFLRGIPFVDLVVLSNQKLKKVVSVYWFMLLLLRAFFSTKFSQKFRVRPIRGCGLYAGKYGIRHQALLVAHVIVNVPGAYSVDRVFCPVVKLLLSFIALVLHD